MRKTLAAAALLAAAAAGLAGCGGDQHSGPVSTQVAEAMPFDWPLTVDKGTVRCVDGYELVFTPDGSKTGYALNGTAKSAGYADITPIWKDNPSTGAKVDIGPLISYSQQFCR